MSFSFTQKNIASSLEKTSIALATLQPFLSGRYIPWTSSALTPIAVSTIINDIIINQRKHIVEFGAGISTILLYELQKSSGVPFDLTSIDHDENWIEVLEKKYSLVPHNNFRFQHAEMSQSKRSMKGLMWYNEEKISSVLQNSPPIDLVLVDGPLAYKKEIELSRYPAYPFIKPYLAENFSVYLDDIHRSGETQISKLWSSEAGIPMKVFKEGGFARLIKGNSYHIDL